MRDIQRILVGIDYSEYSREAARHAVYLAKAVGASVDFLHVSDLPVYMGPGYGPYQLDQLKSHLANQQEKERTDLDEIKRFVAEFEKDAVPFRYFVTADNAPSEIIRVAREMRSDLIVIGTHGRAGLSQILLGSVAEKVVRKAACPVLTVKLTNHPFLMTS